MVTFFKKCAKKIIFLLTVFLFSSFLLFDTYEWGKYAFLLCSFLILLIGSILNGGKITFRGSDYLIINLLFVIFCFSTSLWAMNSNDAIVKARTLFRLVLCAYCVYTYYITEDSVQSLLNAIKWSGYIIAVYSIFFYGIVNLMKATQSDKYRIENAFTNVNSIGLVCALSIVLQFNDLLNKKSFIPALLLIPTMLVLSATQSRKAIVYILLGVIGVILVRNFNNSKNKYKSVLKALFIVVIFIVVTIVFSQLPFFDGINSRMSGLINQVLGIGEVDSSTAKRRELVSLGMTWFLYHPIGGIGIGNSHIIVQRYVNQDYYLHNNFVELLCCGGIIGFTIYYSAYVYIFINLIKYRKVDSEAFTIGVVWLVLMFIMSYGMVTYYSKTETFYLMTHFVNVSCMRRKAKIEKIRRTVDYKTRTLKSVEL